MQNSKLKHIDIQIELTKKYALFLIHALKYGGTDVQPYSISMEAKNRDVNALPGRS